MRILVTLLLVLGCITCRAQQDTTVKSTPGKYAVYVRHSFIPSLAIGILDGYRDTYSLPAGFTKNNTSGLPPAFLKLEYGYSENVSLAVTFSRDAFQYNFSQHYLGNNGPFIRYKTDAFRAYGGGVAAFYHLGKLIRVKQLDPFVGIGLSLNNIRYNAYPSGDSTAPLTDHTITGYLKAGARYYISDNFSLYADAGYDKHSNITLGFSCRFFAKKKGQ